MIKNNPYDLLEKEGIAKGLLSPAGQKALTFFDKVKKDHERHPKEESLLGQAEKMGELASQRIRKEITAIKQNLVTDQEKAEKAVLKKAQSRKIIEKSEKTLDDLSVCRERLKEERKRKIESGEIAPPKKRTLATKLRNDLGKVAGLIPKDLKGDSDVIKRTQKAVLNFLVELKSIWGLNKIKPIQEEIIAKFKKLEKTAEHEA